VAGVDVIEERAVLDREGGVGGLPPEPEVDQKGDDNSAPDPECKLRPDHRPHPRGPGRISVRIGPRRCGVGLWHDGCVVAWGTGLSRAENAAAEPVASQANRIAGRITLPHSNRGVQAAQGSPAERLWSRGRVQRWGRVAAPV
jgi:hypothetical protein